MYIRIRDANEMYNEMTDAHKGCVLWYIADEFCYVHFAFSRMNGIIYS